MKAIKIRGVKPQTMKRTVVTALAAGLFCSALATDYVWVNEVGGGASQGWDAPSSWKVGDAVADGYPQTLADRADLSLRPRGGAQDVGLPRGDLEIGSLVGTVQHMLHFPFGVANVMVGDPTGFRGLWNLTSTSGRAETFVTLDSAAETAQPTFGAVLSENARVNVRVADGRSGRVGALYGGGQIAKTGAGRLAVGPVASADRARLFAAEGDVTLEGHDSTTDGRLPIGGAWVHFDASATDSYLETEARADGRTYVTKWGDLSGNGHHATKSDNPYVESAPFVNAVRRPNGLNLMDFGSWVNDKSEDRGPSCGIQFEGSNQNHELFIVFEDTSANSCGYFFGEKGGAYLTYARHQGGNIFHQDDGTATEDYVRAGAITLDGVRVADGAKTPLGTWDAAADAPRLRVLSVGIDASVETVKGAVCQIAADRGVRRAGGIRVGEFIVYTNSFTHAERLRVVRYLKKKWLPVETSDERTDLGTLNLKASATQGVEVPAGREAQVGYLRAKAGSFVKTGAGTLAVDRFDLGVSTVDVREGAVALRPVFPAADDTKPADAPCAWFDANMAASLVEATGEVVEWRDVRYDGTSVTLAAKAAGSGIASLAEGPDATLKTVAFDGGMSLSAAQDKTRDGFIVVQIGGDETRAVNVFGGADFKRPSNLKYLLSGTYEAGVASMGARWHVNGRLLDPHDGGQETVFTRGDWYVVSFAADAARTVDSFANDGAGNAGGIRVGEMILYDRALTETERRQTEAYLMKRWLGRTSPTACAALPTLAYAETCAVVIDTDSDMDVPCPTGGNGTLVKRGAGTVTLPRLYDGDMRSFAVEAGTLALDFGDPGHEALYHVDATDVASLVAAEEMRADGSVQTNVTRWLDVRRNGAAGVSLKGTSALAVADPTYATVETRTGVSRPVVSLGAYRTGSAFQGADAAAISFGTADVREIHVVFGDVNSGDGNHKGFILGDSAHYPFARGWDGQLGSDAENAYAELLDQGVIRLDGQDATRQAKVTDYDGHLLMVAPREAVPFTALAYDRGVRAGGLWYGEVIAFGQTNTTEVASFIQQQLRHKWFGNVAEPVWTNAVSSLLAQMGATLDFRNRPVVSVAKLAGAGTIRLGAAINVSSLELSGALTVDGTVAFAPEGCVTYTGADLPMRGGTSVKLLEAEAFEGVESLGAWTFDGLPTNRLYRLRVEGNVLYLDCVKRGLAVIIR